MLPPMGKVGSLAHMMWSRKWQRKWPEGPEGQDGGLCVLLGGGRRWFVRPFCPLLPSFAWVTPTRWVSITKLRIPYYPMDPDPAWLAPVLQWLGLLARPFPSSLCCSGDERDGRRDPFLIFPLPNPSPSNEPARRGIEKVRLPHRSSSHLRRGVWPTWIKP